MADAFVEEDRALRAELIDSIEANFYKRIDEEDLDDASLKDRAGARRPFLTT